MGQLLSDIFGIRVASFVRCGDLWISPREIETHISRYSEHLFFYTHFLEWEVSRRGSCFLAGYRGRSFAICTYHQVKNFNPEFIAVQGEGEHRYVTAGAMYWDTRLDSADWDDAIDFAAFDFSQSVGQGLVDRGRFCSWLGSEYLRSKEKVVGAIIVGFADSDQRDDLEDDESTGSKLTHMLLSKRIFVGEYCGDSYQNEIFLIKYFGDNIGSHNGLSGSPVFLICGDAGDFCVKFGGLVVRAGNGQFHCLKHTAIRRLLDQSFGDSRKRIV
ncbi:hypothetical protein [Pararhodobacter marinus]|uniref:hypothetical protein n=2 Tax=Pararhodobacter marinus TaxID=2184063 RepID=UPI0035128E5B